MKDFDIEKLERKNIYNLPEDLFENVREKVLSGINHFDIEQLERKNIYKVNENLFENIQAKVLSEVKVEKQTPIFKLNWGYAAAASFALIFGSTFLYNSSSDSVSDKNSGYVAVAKTTTETESELAFKTLQSDLSFVETKNNASDTNPAVSVAYIDSKKQVKAAENQSKKASKKTEAQMTELLDNFSNSEIAELANNSTQDVYLDLYN